MKFLIAFTALFSMSLAFADGVTSLKNGDLNLSQASSKITNVREICPANPGGIRCMAVGSVVTVKVTMNGCLDRFGGYFSKFEVIDNKGYLFLGTTNIFNKASMVARCVQAPFEIIQLHVPFEGEIELVNLEYMGTEIAQ